MIYYKKKIQQDVGATAVEYGILSALIAVVTILALQATGTNLGTTYCTIANQLSQAVGAGATVSGCSASSSGSSGSSAAGSSASSSGSSNSAESSSDTSSGADSSSPRPVIYNASNSYSIRDEQEGDGKESLNILVNAAQHGITTMSGLYDQYGKEITTPSQLASMFGAQSEYENYQKTMDGYLKYPSTDNLKAESSAKIQLYNSVMSYYQSHDNSSTLYSPQIFLNNPSDVSFSGTDAASGKNFTTTYTKTTDNYGYSS